MKETKNLVEALTDEISQAKEKILRDIISKIEGRPATNADAHHLILSKDVSCALPDREIVIYKGIKFGYIEFSLEKMTVSFISFA